MADGPGDQGDSVRYLQEQLAARGFNPGPIDGIYGPQTAAAVRAFQASVGAPQTGTMDDGSWALMSGTAGGGGTTAADDPLRLEVQRLYPQYAWALNTPGLGDVLLQAAREQWDEGRIVSAIQATDWWKSRNESARRYQELINTDPATAEQTKQTLALQMKQWAMRSGIPLGGDDALARAEKVLTFGQTAAEWQGQIISDWVGNSNHAQVQRDQLRGLASQYGIPLSDQTMLQWETQLLQGLVDQNTFESYLREQAKSLYPSLSAAIDSGLTVRQYVEPYAQLAQQELGINPADFNLSDPKWSASINQIDPKTGDRTSLSLQGWLSKIRTDPIYGYDTSLTGRDRAAQFAEAIGREFGAFG